MRKASTALVAVLAVALAGSAWAVELQWREGTVRGFPVIIDPPSGKVIAWGEHVQRVSGRVLVVTTRFDFGDGRRVEERSEFLQGRELSQRRWRWEERVGGEIRRVFQVDFATGQATALKVQEGKRKEWKRKVRIVPGTTFAGGGFPFALRNLAGRLRGGETVELTAIAFTPRPRAVTVRVFSQGREPIDVAGRTLVADHLVIRPKVPWIARPFVKPPDNHIWLHRTPPPTFLRSAGPLMEPGDPIVRIDVEAPAVGSVRGKSARRTGGTRR